MRISIIAAIARNGVIGADNRLPWRLEPDLQRFKRLTMGHTLVMGRRTFESIGRPLPGRTTIVVSRRDDYSPQGVTVAGSLGAALARAEGDEVFIAGGASIYEEGLASADRLYLTRIAADFEGDVVFPTIELAEWREVERESHEPGEDAAFGYAFVTYDRAATV